MNTLLKAIDFAAKKHVNQRRKNAHAPPYINHVIEVAELLANLAGIEDEEVLIAAVLHDTLEDTATTPEELGISFGQSVRQLVQEVSDDKSLPKQERKQRQIERAAAKSHGAKLIALSDKICNVKDVIDDPPPDWSRERVIEYIEWSRTVVDQMRGTNVALENEFDRICGAAHFSWE